MAVFVEAPTGTFDAEKEMRKLFYFITGRLDGISRRTPKKPHRGGCTGDDGKDRKKQNPHHRSMT
jgi:hypothetical protein